MVKNEDVTRVMRFVSANCRNSSTLFRFYKIRFVRATKVPVVDFPTLSERHHRVTDGDVI